MTVCTELGEETAPSLFYWILGFGQFSGAQLTVSKQLAWVLLLAGMNIHGRGPSCAHTALGSLGHVSAHAHLLGFES